MMKYPIRVLNIVTKMDRGGIESRLMELFRSIDRGRIIFDFYTFGETYGEFDEEINSLGGRVFYNSKLNIHSLCVNQIKFHFFLSAHPEYEIVHCHLNVLGGFLLKIAYHHKIKTRIAHARAEIIGSGLKYKIANILKLYARKYSNYKFAVSKKAAIWMFGEKAVRNGLVRILPNSINCKNFIFNSSQRIQQRSKLGLNDSLVLLHVGNLSPVKNHKYLLNIFKSVNMVVKNSKLLIVGKDNMNGTLQSYAIELGISPNVIFCGQQVDVSSYYFASDVFVFPSIFEGFPGAVLEAQASGLMCYISDRITDEVVLSQYVQKLSLRDFEGWVEKITNTLFMERENAFRIVVNKGYDIVDLSNQMIDFYESSLES